MRLGNSTNLNDSINLWNGDHYPLSSWDLLHQFGRSQTWVLRLHFVALLPSLPTSFLLPFQHCYCLNFSCSFFLMLLSINFLVLTGNYSTYLKEKKKTWSTFTRWKLFLRNYFNLREYLVYYVIFGNMLISHISLLFACSHQELLRGVFMPLNVCYFFFETDKSDWHMNRWVALM